MFFKIHWHCLAVPSRISLRLSLQIIQSLILSSFKMPIRQAKNPAKKPGSDHSFAVPSPEGVGSSSRRPSLHVQGGHIRGL